LAVPGVPSLRPPASIGSKASLVPRSVGSTGLSLQSSSDGQPTSSNTSSAPYQELSK